MQKIIKSYDLLQNPLIISLDILAESRLKEAMQYLRSAARPTIAQNPKFCYS